MSVVSLETTADQNHAIEELLKRARDFYKKSPDGQYDEVALQCINYALAMAPWETIPIQRFVFNGLRKVK